MAEGRPRFGEQPLPQTVAAAGRAPSAGRSAAGSGARTSHRRRDARAVRRVGAGTGARRSPPIPRRASGRTAPRLNACTWTTPSMSARTTRAFPSTRSTISMPTRRRAASPFPLVFEGPPGLVNGGFLAVFFDCVTQHQSCASGRTGKTRSLTVTFRRPTPILTELGFDVARSEPTAGSRPRRGCCSATRCCASANSARRLRRRTS